MCYLFDSNVFIYHFNGVLGDYGRSLLRRGLNERGSYSVISRIEVLGFPHSGADDNARHLFNALKQLELTSSVVQQTIALRCLRKIKIPDAIIAATALSHQLPLVTHNTRDFVWIEGLQLIDPLMEQI